MRSPYCTGARHPFREGRARPASPQATQHRQPCARCSVTINAVARADRIPAGQHARSPSRRSAVRRTRHMPRIMLDRGIGDFGPAVKRLARMALLATGLFAGRSAQAGLAAACSVRHSTVACRCCCCSTPNGVPIRSSRPVSTAFSARSNAFSARNAAITARCQPQTCRLLGQVAVSGGVIDTLTRTRPGTCHRPRQADDLGCYVLSLFKSLGIAHLPLHQILAQPVWSTLIGLLSQIALPPRRDGETRRAPVTSGTTELPPAGRPTPPIHRRPATLPRSPIQSASHPPR